MSETWIYALGSVLLVSLVSLIGIFTISLSVKTLNKALIYLISLSAGALIGDAFIHLLPEIVEENGFTLEVSLYVILGIVGSFAIEKIIHWRHCHHPTTDEHPHPFALMNLFGDGVHNFIDGLIIGAAYLVSIPVGIATTFAVILHEIPQEIGDFGVLLHGGFSKKKALLLNFGIGLIAVLGTLLALLLGGKIEGLSTFVVPFAAGSFIYIASADLIPELHKETKVSKSLLQLFWFGIGIAAMVSLLYVEIV